MYVKFVHSELQALGIEYLSAVLKEHGHITKLIVEPSFNVLKRASDFIKHLRYYREAILMKILSDKPDLIAFSVTSYNMVWACELASEIKKYSDLPIVFGGIQATLMPENILLKSNADFVIQGEGEQTLCELVDSMENNKVNLGINNLCTRVNGKFFKNNLRNLEPDLDSLPMPDKEILPYWLNTNLYRIITGRGCPMVCSYCCAPLQQKIYNGKGKFIRRRSVDNVINELKIAKAKYKIKRVLFEDDLFTYDKEWLRYFSERYKNEISVPFLIHASPETIDEEIVMLLKRCECYCVEIGVQSLNQRIREEILQRYDTNKQIRTAISLLKKNDINCICDNIIGIPGTDEKDMVEMVKFYNDLRPGKLEVLRLEFYPETPIIHKSTMPEKIISKINKCGFAVSDSKDMINLGKITVFLSLIYLLPRKIIAWMLDKKLYRFLPSLYNFGTLNEMIFYLSSILKRRRSKIFISFRADIFLKFRYLLFNVLFIC